MLGSYVKALMKAEELLRNSKMVRLGVKIGEGRSTGVGRD